MNDIIRHENPDDFYSVENVTREAFWNLYKPGCEEHFMVHSIRKHKDYIPELSFVIEKDGEIVGSIFYTHAKIIDSQGTEHKVITFGPVSILPSLHRRGLGRKLITHSINKAKELGYNGIIIGGFPYHYRCYGFEGAKKYGISMPDGNFYTGIMALPLYEGALDNICGSIHFSECMYVDANEVEIFDKIFPEKQKEILPCQIEFEKAVADLDEDNYKY
ncbi:MAG: GNAT family N-acetyltransferase [Eubacteriaceae bacterium]